MLYTLNPVSLINSFHSAEMNEPKCKDFLDEHSEASNGTRYLYKKVLMPMLENQDVHSSDLDMEQFELEDVQDIYDYYDDQISNRSCTFQKLNQFYKALSEAESKTHTVPFI